MFATVSRDADLQHRPEAEVEEVEAGPLDFHELESDVASQQGCYSPVSSVSDMEPSADHGTLLRAVCSLQNTVSNIQTPLLSLNYHMSPKTGPLIQVVSRLILTNFRIFIVWTGC